MRASRPQQRCRGARAPAGAARPRVARVPRAAAPHGGAPAAPHDGALAPPPAAAPAAPPADAPRRPAPPAGRRALLLGPAAAAAAAALLPSALAAPRAAGAAVTVRLAQTPKLKPVTDIRAGYIISVVGGAPLRTARRAARCTARARAPPRWRPGSTALGARHKPPPPTPHPPAGHLYSRL